MAKTFDKPIQEWDTFHNNGPFPAKLFQRTHLEASSVLPSRLDRYNDAAVEIRRLVQLAADAGEGFRALGSAWSLSSIAQHHDRVHSNLRMNIKLPVTDEDLHTDTTYLKENLFLFQCGNIIKEISEFLFDHGKSLKTTGASNGQTIAGAISTGVHGSAAFTGAVQDFVVGINIITGPDPRDIVYLERKSKPALNNEFAKKLKARVIRDDDLFNSALVSLGAFGFIHGVVVEAEELFLLKRITRKIWIGQIMDLIDDFNFANLKSVFKEAEGANGSSILPYHFKVFINPYNKERKWMIEAMFKQPYRLDYKDPVKNIQKSLYKDLIAFFSKFIRKFPKSIPALMKRLEKQAIPPEDLDVEGTLKEIFWDAPHFGAVFAVAMAIDIKDAPRAIPLLIDLVKDKPVPGAYAVRFVKGTDATLGFTRFSKSCIIEMDGIQWKASKKIISPDTFYAQIIKTFKAANIEFTHHWGKNAKWDFPNLVTTMYGEERVKKWKLNRAKLLTPQMAKLFSNHFLEKIGLADLLPEDPPVV